MPVTTAVFYVVSKLPAQLFDAISLGVYLALLEDYQLFEFVHGRGKFDRVRLID
jgi:hypothetical protein